MLPSFDRGIVEILERVASKPPGQRASPRNKGPRPQVAGQRPYYYDVEHQADADVKKKFSSGILGKIDAMHQASQGGGDIPELIDVVKTPTSSFTQASRKNLYVARSISRTYGLRQPDPVKRPNIFRDMRNANQDIYYKIDLKSRDVQQFDKSTNSWLDINDVEIIKRVRGAYDFSQKPTQGGINRNLPPQ
jgi:hypothetical protein